MMFFGVPLLTLLMVAWAVLTVILVLLLIYRGVTAMHQDDQLFLSASESQFERDQVELVARIQKLSPYIRILTAFSVTLIVVIGALWLYQGMISRG